MERFLNDRRSFLELARNSDWIGGHIPRDSMANCLVWVNRPVEYYTSVREPIAQLVSHLNYSFERYGRDDYYDFHGPGSSNSTRRSCRPILPIQWLS